MSGPPPAPEIRRSFNFTRRQWVGIPILFAIPLLAIAGVFGEHTTARRGKAGALAARIVYPDRIHYRQQMALRLSVRNAGGVAADTIIVAFDTAYMRAFTAVRFTPDVRYPYVVPLVHVAPGEARLVTADLTGDQAGWHRGILTVASGVDTLRVPLSSVVFP